MHSLNPSLASEPAGDKEPFYALKTELDEERKVIDPETFAEDDPMRPGRGQGRELGQDRRDLHRCSPKQNQTSPTRQPTD